MKTFIAGMRERKSKYIADTIANAKNRRQAKQRVMLLTVGSILLIGLIVNWAAIVFGNIIIATVLNIIIGTIFIQFVFDVETLELIIKEIEKKPD